MKPAEGLLTTASGRLVVRPTAGGGGGSGVCGREADRGNESSRAGGGDKGAAPSIPMMRLHAAWPLTFIWVDPERDLKRFPPREIVVEEIVDLARGHKTPAFWQQASHRGIHTLPDPKLCFSLVGHDRSLDLAAESLPEAREWVCALARVALMAKRGGLVEAAGDAVAPLLPHRFWPEPAASPAGPDLEENMSGERLIDVDHEVDSRVGGQRQSDRAATALNTEVSRHEVSLRSDADLSSEIPKVFGEGGAWSVDTIHAWRRRLFPAVRRGDIAAVLAIFDQGCPVDIAQTGTGDTPMLLACRLGDVGMVRECLRRGSRNDPHPAFGQTALQAAVASGQEACARLILETAAPSRSDAVVSNHKDPNKETPLHVACRRGYDGIVEALLHHGADLRAVDRKGNTPLHGAAGSGHAGALGSLLDAGGDVVLEERNARGDRALHTAAAPGHIACVELLLGTAAEPDVPNADGQTPFALASRGGHLAVTRLIRKYAPAAGTPSGGDAQFQAHRRANEGGGSATADALPRPHSSGSASNPTPDHRSRDLEHRCYSAAGLGHQQFEDLNDPTSCRQPVYTSGADSSDRDLLRSTSEQDRRGLYARGGELHNTKATPPQSTVEEDVISPASSASAPVQGRHGSLFDGLQVYVVGGRQPLGSQHSCAAPGNVSALARVPVSARTMVLDSHRLSTASHHHQRREEQQQQHQNYYPSNQHTSYNSSLSTASFEGLDPNWRDNVLSAPSTVAPSPPTPVLPPEDDRRPSCDSTPLLSAVPSTATTNIGDGTSVVGVPGSARALARMIHFNSTNGRDENEISRRVLGRGTSRSGATAGQEAVEIEESEKEGWGGENSRFSC
ncbi:Ankyrin [Ectocarpus siliculosus]|uniref:Ankyrin n=1 Tax=Ectocarpus siliculosus TaxID=2880 RepID=D8LE78_ECTSI|nr:Ankyrin [Ectocarpus siliculosus]|eukprot:CBN74153.1 Ankyrin [Ectocarpus siliculosus]